MICKFHFPIRKFVLFALLLEYFLKVFNEQGLSFFRFEGLPENGRIQHAIFTRQGGTSLAPFHSLNLSVSVPDDKECVRQNRARAYGLYGRSSDTVVHAHLVHGRDVSQVTSAQNGTWVAYVDGLITNQPGCALTMNFADCAPIFLYDPLHRAIGLGHAGWQGAIKDLPGAMVQAMEQAFDSRPSDLVAAIGPCIGACCYEVGEVVITAVQATFEAPETLLQVPQNGRQPHFDLAEANRRNLERAGVHQIETSGLCTACRTDLFFSHRAEKGKTGRFGTMFILGS